MAEKGNKKSHTRRPSLSDSVHSVAPDVAVDFLKNTMPFGELEDGPLYELAKHCRIDFYPKGTRLFTYNESEVTHLLLIQRGGVKAFITDEKGDVVLKDYRGVGSHIGALGIIRGTKANLNIETVEDTFCFLISREIFLELVQNHSAVARFYLKSFSDNVVATAYTELRSNKLNRRSSDDLYLFNVTAGDLTKTPFSVSASTSIQEAAAIMSDQSIGSLLIYADEEPGAIIGIITDTDLRSKVIAEGRDYRQPVMSVMSGPLKTVTAQTLCFDVLLKMMSTGIHHLGVSRKGRVIGVVTSHDIMVQQGNSPYYLFKEIVAQSDFTGLYTRADKISGIVRNIINEGAKAGNITRMIALLNEQVLKRVLTLLHEQLGPAPVNYCWLLLGSEGRREQTFKTDQDNGIVYVDPQNEDERERVEKYFSRFAQHAVEHLVKCGYPLCPNNIMASNPQWCQSLSTWKNYFQQWIEAADPNDLSLASLFFDFRCGYGTEQIAVDLRDHLVKQMQRESPLLHYLAMQCVANRAPLSFFNNFVVEKNGENKDMLDIENRGLKPIADFARILALRCNIRGTNTFERLKRLLAVGEISKELFNATIEAYELQMQLQVIHQLSQIESGSTPDNFINPAHLTDIEERMLKDAFRVIEKMQGVLVKLFPEA